MGNNRLVSFGTFLFWRTLTRAFAFQFVATTRFIDENSFSDFQISRLGNIGAFVFWDALAFVCLAAGIWINNNESFMLDAFGQWFLFTEIRETATAGLVAASTLLNHFKDLMLLTDRIGRTRSNALLDPSITAVSLILHPNLSDLEQFIRRLRLMSAILGACARVFRAAFIGRV